MVTRFCTRLVQIRRTIPITFCIHNTLNFEIYFDHFPAYFIHTHIHLPISTTFSHAHHLSLSTL